MTRLSIKKQLSISDVCRDALNLKLFNALNSEFLEREDEKVERA